MKYIASMIFTAAAALCACGGGAVSTARVDGDVTKDASELLASVPFDRDSAYAYVAMQCAFGPRVPGTPAHDECGRRLVSELRRHRADTVIVQPCVMTAYDGTRLELTNIMARYNPGLRDRLLLVAHWDSRHIADGESDPSLRDTPIDGANDGASGVGVLLEIARRIGAGDIEIGKTGVDILFVDGEDYGAPSDYDSAGDEDTWCLGTQYWVNHMPYGSDDRVRGILLDMVGGRGATFAREIVSEYFAPQLNAEVWSTAARLGLAGRFVNSAGGGVTDDHLYINRAGIPTIDIIESSHPVTGSFNPTWHTHDDNIDNIDPGTLGDVGAVVTQYLKSLQK